MPVWKYRRGFHAGCIVTAHFLFSVTTVYIHYFPIADCVLATTEDTIHYPRVLQVNGVSYHCSLLSIFLPICAPGSLYAYVFYMSPQFRPQIYFSHRLQHIFSSSTLKRLPFLPSVSTHQQSEPPSPYLYLCSQPAPATIVHNISLSFFFSTHLPVTTNTFIRQAVTTTPSRDYNAPCEPVPSVTLEFSAAAISPNVVLSDSITNTRAAATTTAIHTSSAAPYHNDSPQPSSTRKQLYLDTARPSVDVPLISSTFIYYPRWFFTPHVWPPIY